ncbi:redox-regulated ATPase YchF [Candidatus Gracilibacteria bacterium]|nr:redox-regulated ATPase YchF [Candidatus Gracilibacteria bacterium]
MNIKIGIVGLPNVGKSTLFNALTKSAQADAQNFPFCTIDPNIGIVPVPDMRVDKLASIVNPERVQRSTVEFVDIAGLVAGASKGEGLGNKFLSHIRECNAICHVLRDFESSEIHHVAGKVDPKSDLEVILTELILADLESVDRQIERVGRKAKTGDKDAKKELELLQKVKIALESNQLASSLDISEEEEKFFHKFNLLTEKKFLVVANASEDHFMYFNESDFRGKMSLRPEIPVLSVCAQIESELVDLSDEEAHEFLAEIGTTKSGLENLIQKAFELLGLQSYFTAGVQEVRAWTIRKGATAPQAAGEIHTDFEKGFIKADVIAYEDFVQYEGEGGAKEAGKMRMEGKTYIVKDGDVMHFKFNN